MTKANEQKKATGNADKDKLPDPKPNQSAAPFEPGKVVNAATGTVRQPEQQGGPAPEGPKSEVADSHTLPVKDATDAATQADTPAAEATRDHIVPGAAAGPDAAGVVRDSRGYVADAPLGSIDAALNGVHVNDATGEVFSNNTDPRGEAEKGGPANLAEFDRKAAEQAGKPA